MSQNRSQDSLPIFRKAPQLALTIFFLTVWLIYMAATQQWGLFVERSSTGIQHWYMSVTMVFGAFIAGATSEGGGAVAFPVMTLLFKIPPGVARNFSLAIQSCGMTAAAYLIFARRIPIDKTYLVLCSIGGVFGIVFGTYAIAPWISPPYVKMLFVTLWLSFGVVLFYANVIKKRSPQDHLPPLPPAERWILMTVGFLGGIISALTGSGIDISSFSFVTTRYNLSEKIATPTSVCLMAGNTVVGFLLHAFVIQDFFNSDAFSYWLVAIPVVIFAAPLGAFFISQRTREFVANFLYVILVVQFVGAWLILKPKGALLGFTLAVFVVGIVTFMGFGPGQFVPAPVKVSDQDESEF